MECHLKKITLLTHQKRKYIFKIQSNWFFTLSTRTIMNQKLIEKDRFLIVFWTLQGWETLECCGGGSSMTCRANMQLWIHHALSPGWSCPLQISTDDSAAFSQPCFADIRELILEWFCRHRSTIYNRCGILLVKYGLSLGRGSRS